MWGKCNAYETLDPRSKYVRNRHACTLIYTPRALFLKFEALSCLEPHDITCVSQIPLLFPKFMIPLSFNKVSTL